jgi:hypothetical protein
METSRKNSIPSCSSIFIRWCCVAVSAKGATYSSVLLRLSQAEAFFLMVVINQIMLIGFLVQVQSIVQSKLVMHQMKAFYF